MATAAHGGSDGGGANTCLSSTAPCLTVQHAVSEAATGDTIQIGPGVFTEAVSTSEQLSFVGAGAGTSTFNPSSDTAIDAASTGSPGLTVSANVSATVTGLRIRGGVFNDGGGGEVEPAIWDNASSSGPALTISNSVLLQANPASPDEIDPALLVTSAKTVVQNSTIVGYEDGISVEHTGATLSLQESTVMTPAPASAGLSANIRAAVLVTGASATINNSTLVGLTALYDRSCWGQRDPNADAKLGRYGRPRGRRKRTHARHPRQRGGVDRQYVRRALGGARGRRRLFNDERAGGADNLAHR